MKTVVEWNGGASFTGLTSAGVPILMQSVLSTDENIQAARPMELIAIGLAGCMAMDVLSILVKKQQKIISYQVIIDAPRSAEYPKVFTSALITFILSGLSIDERAVLRSIELAATKYCPAHAMLVKAFPISIGYEIYEGEREPKQLLCQGIWQQAALDDPASNI